MSILSTFIPNRCKILLKVDDKELIQECDVVTRVPAVPHRQKHQGAHLADVAVVEELESLVHVVHDPGVGIDVEGLDVVTELLRRLQPPQLDICTSSPVSFSGTILGLLEANVGEAGDDADALRHQPNGEVLGKDQLAPDGKQHQLQQEGRCCVAVTDWPKLRKKH